MPVLEQILISVSSLCDDSHTVEFTNQRCVVKKDKCVVGIGERTGGMCSANLQQASERTFATPNVTGDVLEVWGSRLTRKVWKAITKMEQGGAVRGLDLNAGHSTNNCSHYDEGTIKYTLMRTNTALETRSGAVVHIKFEKLDVPSVVGAKYFVPFIDQASEQVSACHIRTKGEAPKLLKRYVCWVKQQKECRVKKIVLDGGKKYIKGTAKRQINGIMFCITASYAPEENGGAERMN